jgi:hypothetical protein
MKIKIHLNLLRESCASFSIGSVFREGNLVKWVVKIVEPKDGHPYAMQGPRYPQRRRSALRESIFAHRCYRSSPFPQMGLYEHKCQHHILYICNNHASIYKLSLFFSHIHGNVAQSTC